MTEIVQEVRRGRGRPKGIAQPKSMRDKIRADAIIKKLHAHIFDGMELSMSQIRSAEILLRKVLPDLTRTLVQADVNVRYVLELPPMLSKEEWLQKYGNKQIEHQPTNGAGPVQ